MKDIPGVGGLTKGRGQGTDDGRESPEIDKYVEDLFFNMIHTSSNKVIASKENLRMEEEESDDGIFVIPTKPDMKTSRTDLSKSPLATGGAFDPYPRLVSSFSIRQTPPPPPPTYTAPFSTERLSALSTEDLEGALTMEREGGAVVEGLRPLAAPKNQVITSSPRLVKEGNMSNPASRRGSVSGDGLFHEMAEFMGRGRGFTSYDLISRTLHQLARDGISEVLNSALDRLGIHGRRRINNLDADKLAPLHYAARYAHADAVRLLIHAGAEVNIRGQDKLTPLHYAARYRKQLKSSRKQSPVPPPPKDEEEEEEEEIGNRGENEENPNGEHESYNLTVGSTQSALTIGIGSISETSVIRILVECGAEVNARDVYDQTPLHYAAMRGNVPAARDLLKCPRVLCEARDKQKMTPLFVAATFGYVDISRRLILAGASIFSKDESEQTPLHRASMEGHLEIVELLLMSAVAAGGKATLERLVSERDSEGQTPLHHAVNNSHLQVARRLLDAGAHLEAVRDTLATPLHAAAAVGNTDLVKLLLQKGARLESADCNQQTPLHRAAAYNQAPVVTLLLNAGASVEKRDTDSFTPLLVAASGGHAAAVQILLSHGADVEAVDKDDKSAVYWCASQGNEEALEVLLSDDHCRELVDVSDRYDNSPLHAAAKHGYMAIVNKLLEAGSKVDNKNEDEETAFHVAAEAGQVRVVRELVNRYKFLLSDENEYSNTPLHLACLQGHTDVARTLLEAGAAVDARNSSLWTPLDCASAKGHVLCVHLLLDYDSPLDPLDKTRTTPLQLAAKEGHVAVTRLLLERGASLSACDTSGRNALELAISAGKRDVCMAIVKSSEWEAGLRIVRTDDNGRRVTPFRMLVKKFPDVAEVVLDRCTSTNGMDSDDRKFDISFNFEFVEDTYTCHNGSDTDSINSISTFEPPFDEEGQLAEDAEPYSQDTRELKNNHPLMLMVKYKRLNLLAHPVSISLVKHKWMSYGRFVYYLTLGFYMIFLIFLTGYILTARDWTSVADEMNGTAVNTTVLIQAAKQQQSCEDIRKEVNLTDGVFVIAGKWVIIVLAALNIMREMFQFYRARLNYIGLENLIEWCCYITAVLLVWDFTDCPVRQDWQWQVGAASIFLAWMNLLLFIRKFPFLGIYVVMFTDIFATFLKFFTVFLLFIVAFALGFYTVLRDQDPFRTPATSLLKTTVMMIGEMEFDAIFNDENGQTLKYPEITYILFVAFLVLMSILIMNLLVGLAVDDIKAVQDQAILKRLAMQTQMVLDVEALIPETLKRVCIVCKKKVYPNTHYGSFSKLFGDFKFMNTFEFFADEEQMNDQETMRRDMTQLMAAVEDLRAQNQRQRALLIALMNVSNRNQNRETSEPDITKYV
ncbi:transient receptor potential cation channel subfamily A member 1 homolog isoform X4 [Procambarus clarkii]|uniref:transient receptor potential cation channel subfamily A member 1 homolog isoform X4 n=1 Tax=Procambarus clarkii TaxID=6728 RepID=UPI0037429803